MRSVAGAARDPAVAFILASLAVLALTTTAGLKPAVVAPVVLVVAIFAAWHRSILQWPSLVGVIIVLILFVPIKRYALPSSLPFNLELYQVVVTLILLAWLMSLLIDPKVVLVRTPLDAPMLTLVACVLLSEISNPGRVATLGSYVTKAMISFLSLALLYFLIAMTVRNRHQIIVLLKLLAGGGTVLGVLAMYERNTGHNYFNQLHKILPFLTFRNVCLNSQCANSLVRFGDLRVYGSGQHPIAFGAAMAFIVPIAVYLARTSNRRWWVAAAIITLGAMATGSRTAVIMIIVEVIVFAWLKRKETLRLWPLVLPGLVLIHIALPGALGSIRAGFFPAGGIIHQQSTLEAGQDPNLAGGRIRQLGPSIAEASRHPLFGEGFGTRVTGVEVTFRNAPILDNQWLGTLLELGYVGFAVWIWLIVRVVRRMVRAARSSDDEEGSDWLFTGLTASIIAFAIGMLTYDTFTFLQATYLFWIVLGLSAAALSTVKQGSNGSAPLPVSRLR